MQIKQYVPIHLDVQLPIKNFVLASEGQQVLTAETFPQLTGQPLGLKRLRAERLRRRVNAQGGLH